MRRAAVLALLAGMLACSSENLGGPPGGTGGSSAGSATGGTAVGTGGLGGGGQSTRMGFGGESSTGGSAAGGSFGAGGNPSTGGGGVGGGRPAPGVGGTRFPGVAGQRGGGGRRSSVGGEAGWSVPPGGFATPDAGLPDASPDGAPACPGGDNDCCATRTCFVIL